MDSLSTRSQNATIRHSWKPTLTQLVEKCISIRQYGRFSCLHKAHSSTYPLSDEL